VHVGQDRALVGRQAPRPQLQQPVRSDNLLELLSGSCDRRCCGSIGVTAGQPPREALELPCVQARQLLARDRRAVADTKRVDDADLLRQTGRASGEVKRSAGANATGPCHLSFHRAHLTLVCP
jgi:hypothetical protein